ncbi:ArsR/SmtB family transcription factor [Bacillus salitolerans]|uniref:ArsR/SmtB family transcription factor n=1 Tax=Bacillus salitolerans TaxID=1437434 RepID=A0ABW4LRM7_9BACI
MDTFKINVEQSKLLGSALRVKILALLADEPKTAKQVADLLEKSPGSVHYHVQLLFKGGLLKIVNTQEIGGIVEKYYQAVAKNFSPENQHTPPEDSISSTRLTTNLLLTKVQSVQFLEELNQVVEKWAKVLPPKKEEQHEYGVEMMLWEKKSTKDEEEE